MTKIKDPIYGYVELEDSILDVIDTPYFQRLRDIIQTSYTSLFPTSVHNRFSHSLGVYFLGKKAIDSLFKNFRAIHGNDELNETKEREIKKTFLMACILHDIGHSPFSHTGEEFYFDEKVNKGSADKPEYTEDSKLTKDLDDLLNDEEYRLDIIKQSFCSPKPHEFMSAYLGLKVFLSEKDKHIQSFFVRCIIGLQYYNCETLEKQLLNACIELLNSSTIDVDKLDYLIRDSYMTGFYSINIDYERLLAGISLHELDPETKNNIIQVSKPNGSQETCKHVFVAFKKQSLSVLENVILANDLERKWIQSHPVVLYSSFLLQIIIHNINEKITDGLPNKHLFSYASLTEEGMTIGNEHIRLLSDSDITFLAKNKYYDNWSSEYFNRSTWRHPLWKSQSEFKILNENISASALEELVKIIGGIEKDLLNGEYGHHYINEDLLISYSKELEEVTSAISSTQNISSKKSLNAIKSQLENKTKFLKFLFEYCNEKDAYFDFVVITNKQFLSGLNKKDFQNIEIQFDKFRQNYVLSKALCILSSEIFDEKYFYMYNKEVQGKQKIDVVDFCKRMDAFVAGL